ncbi:MAG: class I SAM-dependent RNA methyltransferase [Lachnospiraceae bacterium]|nr:class I SAM-dependent RNA methyltransferase [Lachnospiraceae bacterium]
MAVYEIIAPCHFGMEAVLKREIYDLGYEISEVSDGKVTFLADEEGIARANICLRTTERLLIKVASFKARTWDELFEGTKAVDWERFIPKNAKFYVAKATSIKSKLFSPSDIQSIMKKAMVEHLKPVYKISYFPEDGATYPLRVTIMKDVVTIGLDTSGESLHKRGYRQATVKAPVTETLAAALIMLTPWREDRILVDPFCGSGTFPIEAAMIGANIAPGMNRHFLAESYDNLIAKKYWKDAFDEANDMVRLDVSMDIQGYDIDPDAIKAAIENADRAKVGDLIHLQVRDVKDLSHRKKYGFVISNPPYGERLETKEDMPALYKTMGEAFKNLDSWSIFLLTSFEGTEECIGRKATKNRKIYNGMLKTYFYQFMGPKPPKRNDK